MAKNVPFNTEDMGLISGRGTKIPRDSGQPSSCTATRWLVLCKERSCVMPQKSQLRLDTAK